VTNAGTLELTTPERVALELPIAGIGSRALAWLIDAGLLLAVGVALYFAFTLLVPNPIDALLGLSRLVRVVGTVGAFVFLWGYWTGLEVWWQGQTIGKRVIGMRVVRADGSPVTVVDSAVRNLLRLIDFLPACYPVGVMCMLLDRQHRRVGDLVAGTLLIRVESIDLSRYEASATVGARLLSTAELELVTELVARFDLLDPAARLALGRALLAKLKIDGATLDEPALRARLEKLTQSGESSSSLSDFVRGRRPEWEKLSSLIGLTRSGALRLEELSTLDRLYRRASADLSRARAAFPGTEVHRFLNQLCGQAYASIYRAPSAPWGTLQTFFTSTFPQVVQATLPYTLVSVGCLLFGVLLGGATVALDPGGAVALIDPGLRAFIDRHELWTDSALSVRTPAEMASEIFTNNLRVTFTAFALGVTAGVGTVAVVLFNGVQFGALVTSCAQHGLGPNIVTFVAAHGPVELSIICLCGGAGLVVGHALVAPGDHDRGAWVRARATLAVQIVLGCAPFLIAVGIIEGFVSPGDLVPWPAKALIGAATFWSFWRYLLRPPRPSPQAT
jgi:uncharacterized membrane protein SpoIIM required for sporulation/uncharacterized RDD family membrane protein YckC